MISKSFIEEVINDHIKGSDKFLIDVKVRSGNIIHIVMDADNGVSIDDCVEISRLLESKLNRDEEDFELKVSSAGIDCSLTDKRQYKKNVGRSIKVLLDMDEIVVGELIGVNEDGIEVRALQGKRKKGQPKADGIQEREIKFVDIKDAKIEVVF